MRMSLEEIKERLERSFSYVETEGDVRTAIERLCVYYRTLADYLMQRTEVSREQSIALTHLEESLLWATEAIVRAQRAEKGNVTTP